MIACLGLLAPAGFVSADAAQDEHVLARTAYGGDAWTRSRIAEIGPEAYLREQLTPSSIDDPAFEVRIAGFATGGMNYREIRANYPDRRTVPLDDLSRMHLLRAVYSRRQLEAVLTDFWFDHFNVYLEAGMGEWDAVPYERDAIRAHVLGRFEDMLLAVARSPSMLDYLNNHESVKGGINENYARELLELHTLGVDGGYTQHDVVAVARVFTGWRIDRDGIDDPAGFRYADGVHDSGPKSIMNSLIINPGHGVDEGLDVISFLAAHPSTARHIARKLAQRFVSDEPPTELVDHLTRVYLESGGDLRAVTEALLLSDAFLDDPANRGTKTRSPVLFVVSALRALGAGLGPEAHDQLRGDLRALGEEPFHAKPPIGYPEDSRAWLSSGAVVGRINVAHAIVNGERDLTFDLGVDGLAGKAVAKALLARIFPAGVSGVTRHGARQLAVRVAPSDAGSVVAGFLLASPEFVEY